MKQTLRSFNKLRKSFDTRASLYPLETYVATCWCYPDFGGGGKGCGLYADLKCLVALVGAGLRSLTL